MGTMLWYCNGENMKLKTYWLKIRILLGFFRKNIYSRDDLHFTLSPSINMSSKIHIQPSLKSSVYSYLFFFSYSFSLEAYNITPQYLS